MGESRQVLRARARANDYWGWPTRLGMARPTRERSCRRTNAQGRDRVSCKVIAAKAPRTRLSPKSAPRHPAAAKHAWQRKKAFWDAMREHAGAPQ